MSIRSGCTALCGALALALLLWPAETAAQCTTLDPPCINHAPSVEIGPAGGAQISSSLAVSIAYQDDSGLNLGSVQITLNGTNVTGQFSTSGSGGTGTSSGTVTLASGSTTLAVTICDTAAECGGSSVVYTYTPPPTQEQRSTPVISLAPYSQDVRTPSPFEARAGYSTAPYVSQDVPRSVTLVHSGWAARARVFLQVDAIDNSTEAPARMAIRVKDSSGAWVTDWSYYTAVQGAANRLAASWTATALATGAYTYTVVVQTQWATGSPTFKEATAAVRVLVVNEQGSIYGAGWGLAGLQRLHFRGDSAMVTHGDGSAMFYRRTGTSTFQKPQGEFSELSWDGSRYHRIYPDGTDVVFFTSGYPEKIRDRYGRQITYGWTGANPVRITSITDPVGKVLTFASTSSPARVTSITDPGGRVWTLGFTGTDRTQVTAPDNVVDFSATYATGNVLRQVANRDGATRGIAYDAVGLVSADSLSAVAIEGGGTQRPIMGYKAWETAFLPPSGTGTQGTPAPAVNTTTMRAEITDASGGETRMQFDRFQQPTLMVTPLGKTTTIWRNEHGQPTRLFAPDGEITSYEWEGPNLIRQSKPESGEVVEYDYQSPYNRLRTVTSGGFEVVFTYGSYGELLTERVGTDTTTYHYAADWRMDWVRDPDGHEVIYSFHTTGFKNLNTIWETDANDNQRTTMHGYDAYGRVSTVTTAAGTTTFLYDLLNRDTSVTNPATRQMRMGYTGNFLTRVTDPAGKNYTSTYNVLGWKQTDVDTNGRTTSYGYELDADLKRATDRRNRQVTFTRDSLGRVLTRTADGATTTYAYDPDGLWVAAQNAESTDSIFTIPDVQANQTQVVGSRTLNILNAWGRLTNHVSRMGGQRFTRGSAYLREGPRDQLGYTAPGVSVRSIYYRYDSLLRLNRIQGPGGAADTTTIRYNDESLPDSVRLPAGMLQTFEHTRTHLPERVKWSVTAVDNPLGTRYTYDGLDRVFSRANGQDNAMRRYDYDVVSQLVGHSNWELELVGPICEDPQIPETCHSDWIYQMQDTSTITYDAVGNRTDNGASREGNSNRYSAFGCYSFTYDSIGNLKRKYKTGFDQYLYWNSLGQLDSVITNDTIKVSYGYNGLGQRVRRTQGSTVTRYIYDGDDLLMEVDGSGNLIREYVMYPGIDQPLSMRNSAGTTYYYSMEYPGHVNGLVNSNNSVVNTYRYTPWGEAETGTNETVTQPLRYMGRELDATTGLYYVRNRWYDPVMQRFITEDPIGLAGGINIYTYVGNSPVNGRDPLGLWHDGGKCALTVMNSEDSPHWDDEFWEFTHQGRKWHAHQTGALVELCESARGFWHGVSDLVTDVFDLGGGSEVAGPNSRECTRATLVTALSFASDRYFFKGLNPSVQAYGAASSMSARTLAQVYARQAAQRRALVQIPDVGGSLLTNIGLTLGEDGSWVGVLPLIGSFNRLYTEMEICGTFDLIVSLF